MSARGPFARVVEFDDGVWIVESDDGARCANVYAICRNNKAEAERIAAALNRAVAHRVAAELEAAAEEAEANVRLHSPYGDEPQELLAKAWCAAANMLRARAKAIREGGGK